MYVCERSQAELISPQPRKTCSYPCIQPRAHSHEEGPAPAVMSETLFVHHPHISSASSLGLAELMATSNPVPLRHAREVFTVGMKSFPGSHSHIGVANDNDAAKTCLPLPLLNMFPMQLQFFFLPLCQSMAIMFFFRIQFDFSATIWSSFLTEVI